MRIVVDTNFLERQELRDYLSKSTENLVVLTDYAAMEAYKSDIPNSIYQRMKVVCEFPTQVVVLRGTQEACGLTGNAAEFAAKVIDPHQTLGFPQFCRSLILARSGNENVQRQLLEHGREARAHLERMLVSADNIAAGIKDIAASYTPTELKIMRRPDLAFPVTLLEKTTHRIMELAASLMRGHPAVTTFPSASEAPDRFLFRFALCGLVLATRWIAVGGADLAKQSKLRNDVVDIIFVAFATYYDGFLTADKRTASIYRESRRWLDTVFSKDRRID